MWNITYGKITELTENDEGYDFEWAKANPDGVQLVWEKAGEK